MAKTILWSDGWQFAKSDLNLSDPVNLEFSNIDLPHDWLIYDTKDLYENSIGWYKKPLHYYGDKHVFLYFEGVYLDCSLYVNGTWIGDWKNGYSSFEYEITHALKLGYNEVLVKVVHQSPNSRWYSGAGIYRDVWLKIRSDDYLVTDGLYISSKPNCADYSAWDLDIECEVWVGSSNSLELSYSIYDRDQVLASGKQVLESVQGMVKVQQTLFVEQVQLWSPETPRLYKIVATLNDLKTNKVVDEITQDIGFKHVILDPEQGLILNGEKIKLNGVCEHHDLGALGAAFNKNALKYRFKILKEMGVNAIRTAHNMPAKGLMELADQMGFLIVSEAFDMWARPKTKYDYARFFKDWVSRDVASWVRRDRNHSSLLMWSIGNEVFDTHVGDQGVVLTKLLIDLVRDHDPKQNAFVTFGSNYLPWENTQICAELLDAVGYNYGPSFYEDHHKKYPHWVIYGSETSAIVQSRGIYHFPLEKAILADDDQQCSALGNSPVSWGAKSTEECLAIERNTPFSLGQFIWTGFDYLGEPTPYHTKNSYFGQIDTAGFPKDSFYIYQAAWTDYKVKPMVHLYPYWSFSPGQMIDVRVCSNAPSVVLKLNGKEIGRKDLRQPKHLYLASWKVPYQEGELKALALDEQGEIIATQVRHSFGDASKISLKANQNKIKANGRDLIFLEISMEDKNGNPVDNATNRVEVKVTGAGRLVGLDNGDSTDYDAYKGISRRLFSGKLMAIIAASLEPGEIKVEVTSPSLPTKVAYFSSLPVQENERQGVSALQENYKQTVHTGQLDEVPVRKIELIADGKRTLTPQRKQIKVYPKLSPANTSYQELEWRVVSAGGIDSKLAILEIKDDHVCLTAKGDGHFRLRCLSKNGTNSICLFSELEFEARGFGKLFKNPYELVAGGLYDDFVGEVGTGNERGVATARGEKTKIGFSDLDFGDDGSDTITIPFFALTNEPYPVQIWEGKPGTQDSVLLADVIYQMPSKWNVYQSATYKLKKRLRGVTTLWIVTHNKMHIKGFYFEQQHRAFTKIYATEYDELYGDQFVLRGSNVEDIGNNVTLDFGEIDFGQEGASEVIFCGRTALDQTMIQLSFTGAQGEIRQQVKFTQASSYDEQVFTIKPVLGKVRLRLIFLPGSQFDLAWFQFLPHS